MKLKNLHNDTQFRAVIYTAYLSFIADDEPTHTDQYPVIYFYFKNVLNIQLPDWLEFKYLVELNYPKYLPMVSPRDLATAGGENLIGVNCFERLPITQDLMKNRGVEDFQARHIVCWGRVCAKAIMSEFGVDAARVREVLEIEEFMPQLQAPIKG